LKKKKMQRELKNADLKEHYETWRKEKKRRRKKREWKQYSEQAGPVPPGIS
jgi:hypothetical protein